MIFGILLLLQLVGMVLHRFSTFVHIVAATSVRKDRKGSDKQSYAKYGYVGRFVVNENNSNRNNNNCSRSNNSHSRSISNATAIQRNKQRQLQFHSYFQRSILVLRGKQSTPSVLFLFFFVSSFHSRWYRGARSTPTLSSPLEVAFVTIPMSVRLNTYRFRPRSSKPQPLSFSALLSFKQSVLCCSGLSVFRRFLNPLSTSDSSGCRAVVMSAVRASLSACPFPVTQSFSLWSLYPYYLTSAVDGSLIDHRTLS